MKKSKIIALLLSLTLLFSFLPLPAQRAEARGIQPEFSSMSVTEFNKAATKDTFAAVLQFDGDLPHYDWGPGAPKAAELKGVTYKLTDNVVKVNSTVTKNILSVRQFADPGASSGSVSRIIEQGGLLDADRLAKATGKPFIAPGTVFVDEAA